MTSEVGNCPKCNGKMTRGFVADHTHGATLLGGWREGPPKRYRLFGLKLPMLLPAIDASARAIPIATYRCEACGYLESYTRPEFGPRE